MPRQRKPGAKYAGSVFELNGGKTMHLPIYIKKYTDKSRFEGTVKRFSDMAPCAPCAIESLEECEDKKEQYTRLSRAILALKNKDHCEWLETDIALSGYVLSEYEQYILITANASDAKQSAILTKCMGFANPETMHLFKTGNISRSAMEEYYRSIMPSDEKDLALLLSRWDLRTSARTVNTYYLSDELNEALKEYLEKPQKSLKSLMTLVWGRLICSLFKVDSVIIKSVHEGGRLKASPVVCHNNYDNVEEYKSILSQYQMAEQVDNYGLDAVKSVLGYDFERYTPMVFDFEHDSLYNNFLRGMESDILYMIRTKDKELTPLLVSATLIGGRMSITYDYANKCFEYVDDFDIYNIHNSFVRTLEMLVFGEMKTAKESVGAGYSRDKVREIKQSVMTRLDMFRQYVNREEIDGIVDNINVLHCNMQDELCRAGQIVEGLYILLTGKVEICAKDDNMVYNPLMILKEGDIFGTELLKTDKKAIATYRIASPDALLLFIKTDDFINETIDHPELISAIADSLCERLGRFQKLWILNS